MNLLELLLYGQASASVLMLFGWLVAIKINNTSYVDALWAYGVGAGVLLPPLGRARDRPDPADFPAGAGRCLVPPPRNLPAGPLPRQAGGCPLRLPQGMDGKKGQPRISSLLSGPSLLGSTLRLTLSSSSPATPTRWACPTTWGWQSGRSVS